MTNNSTIATPYLGAIDEPIIGPSVDFDLDDYVLEPWPGRILVQRFDKEVQSEGGIHLTEGAQETKNWGEVVRMPKHNPPPGVAVGDIVLFLREAGDPADAFGKGFVLLEYAEDFQGDIIGILRKKDGEAVDSDA